MATPMTFLTGTAGQSAAREKNVRDAGAPTGETQLVKRSEGRFQTPRIAVPKRIGRHVAIHEAAHAVAAWSMDAMYFGYSDLPFDCIALSPAPGDPGSRAHVLMKARYQPVGTAARKAIDAGNPLEAWKARMRMEADVVGALAGAAASAKYLRYSSTFILLKYGKSDSDIAYQKLADFVAAKDDGYPEFDRLYEQAALVVARGWTTIVALATELLQKRDLDAVEAAAIIETEGGAELLRLPDELRRAIDAAKTAYRSGSTSSGPKRTARAR